MRCEGFWPDTGTPCLRILKANGLGVSSCPKAGDPDHTNGGFYVGHPHTVIDVESVVTGELVAKYCPTCEDTVWTWDED